MFSHVSFTSIPVDDAERARDFYSGKLGLTATVDAPFEGGRWIMLGLPDARTRIHLDDRPGRVEPEGRPVLPLIAPDIDEAIGRLRETGVEIVSEPRPAEWDPDARYALVRDSEGNLVLIATA